MRSVMDHMLAMALFIGMLVEFLLVKQAGTSTFFLLMIIALVDVLAGFIIGMRSGRAPGRSRRSPSRLDVPVRANATACGPRGRPLADCAIGGDRLLGLGAAARAGLRRLRRGGDQVGDEVRIGTRARPHRGGGWDRCVTSGTRALLKGHLLSRNGTFRGFPVQVASAVPRIFRNI